MGVRHKKPKKKFDKKKDVKIIDVDVDIDNTIDQDMKIIVAGNKGDVKVYASQDATIVNDVDIL